MPPTLLWTTILLPLPLYWSATALMPEALVPVVVITPLLVTCTEPPSPPTSAKMPVELPLVCALLPVVMLPLLAIVTTLSEPFVARAKMPSESSPLVSAPELVMVMCVPLLAPRRSP